MTRLWALMIPSHRMPSWATQATWGSACSHHPFQVGRILQEMREHGLGTRYPVLVDGCTGFLGKFGNLQEKKSSFVTWQTWTGSGEEWNLHFSEDTFAVTSRTLWFKIVHDSTCLWLCGSFTAEFLSNYRNNRCRNPSHWPIISIPNRQIDLKKALMILYPLISCILYPFMLYPIIPCKVSKL